MPCAPQSRPELIVISFSFVGFSFLGLAITTTETLVPWPDSTGPADALRARNAAKRTS
jgi:hypothetical protein